MPETQNKRGGNGNDNGNVIEDNKQLVVTAAGAKNKNGRVVMPRLSSARSIQHFDKWSI